MKVYEIDPGGFLKIVEKESLSDNSFPFNKSIQLKSVPIAWTVVATYSKGEMNYRGDWAIKGERKEMLIGVFPDFSSAEMFKDDVLHDFEDRNKSRKAIFSLRIHPSYPWDRGRAMLEKVDIKPMLVAE